MLAFPHYHVLVGDSYEIWTYENYQHRGVHAPWFTRRRAHALHLADRGPIIVKCLSACSIYTPDDMSEETTHAHVDQERGSHARRHCIPASED